MICLADTMHAPEIPKEADVLWQGAFLDGSLRYFTIDGLKTINYVFVSPSFDFWGTVGFDPERLNLDTFFDACNELVEQQYYELTLKHIKDENILLN